MDPASLQVDRRARRVKTDRIDVEKLLQALIAWAVVSAMSVPWW